MPDNKPTNRERLREITEGIEQGIKELFESEKYIRYLSVMSRFHRYSVNNTMLIYNTGSRTGLIDSLSEMRGELSPEETELLALTDSTLSKLRAMTDDEFAVLELYPDFDE